MPENAERLTARPIDLFPPDFRTCGSCSARIVWAFTTSGKKMPVDARPSPNGNVLLVRMDNKIQAQVLGKLDRVKPELEGSLRASHHFTCPHGKDWRR